MNCRECRRDRPTVGRGLCRTCYNKARDAAQRAGGVAWDEWRSYKWSRAASPCACGAKHYLKGLCRRCHSLHPVYGQQVRDRQRRWHEANRGRVRANRRAYYERTKEHLKHPDRTRVETLRLHGLKQADYDAMHAAQDGRCAICRCTEQELLGKGKALKRLAVDHCHTTGRIRGLLCRKCNTALGLLGDDLAGIWAALNYLTDHQGVTVPLSPIKR